MLLISIGYSELNKADPDCGTTFTWATRAFGPKTGWAGGWGIIASDVLVMASLAEVPASTASCSSIPRASGTTRAASGCSSSASLFIVVLTYVCYRGIEVSAKIQLVLLAIELVMMAVYALVAMVRVATGHAPPGHMVPSMSWFNPTTVSSTKLIDGLVLMLFIYWGWDTSLSVNEETSDKERLPGLAGIIATVLLLATYGLVVIAAQAFAGVGIDGHRPDEPGAPHRRAVGTGYGCLRFELDRLGLLAPAVPHGVLLGCRLYADDDPAHGPYGALDERLQGDPGRVR